jgi:hypothetical protein
MSDTDNPKSDTEEKGPTEKLRDDAKPQSEQLVPGTEVPGAQEPGNEEIKEEKGPNTE